MLVLLTEFMRYTVDMASDGMAYIPSNIPGNIEVITSPIWEATVLV
jgi:hypothetical protein